MRFSLVDRLESDCYYIKILLSRSKYIMLENDKLQQIFDSFGLSLKEYIKEEVQRQVDAKMSSMEVEEEEDAVVGMAAMGSAAGAVTGAATGVVAATANVTTMDLQASLDQLADLANSAKDSVVNGSVLDDLVSKYGNVGSGMDEVAPVAEAVEEESMKVAPADEVGESMPAQEDSGLSVLQGLVDKIRARKNLASN